MSANQATYPVETLARTMGVSRSGFYAWVAREPSTQDIADQELSGLIRQIHDASHQTYGAPRIRAELAARGVRSRRSPLLRREA